VLNGFNSGKNGPPHAFGRYGVGDHRPAAAGGYRNDGFQFRLRIGWCCNTPRAPAIVGVYLDQIYAATDLLSHRTGEGIETIGLLGAQGRIHILVESLGAVAACRNERFSCDQQTRAGNDALFD